ncbi:hypothetical protein CIPAW_06G002200 [Carya illinoinensis]|uniref:RING-type E3 ubiquitin transferase n=1 Tax=Carya illinoinensis TaxID=32201 RepID=A0A8T1Q5V4_CARIL|nr:hypothetical protein CIPAW_06G002200 [Carya illinoinensis]
MGSVEAIEEEREFDVEETIFVAVGKNVEESKTTLFWAVQNFVGKKICVLHVHQPEHVVEPTDINFSAKRLKQPIREELWEVKHQKQDELLDQYLLLLVQAGVEADKIWIEMNKVEKGIVDTIAAHNIRWLAMGGAAEKHYSEELSELKSKKAFFVCQQAPISCHVWFVCKGRLIYTRGGSKDSVDLEIASPLLLLGSDIENEQLQNSVSESFTNECNADAEGDGNELERISRSLTSQCSVCSSSSTNRVVGTSKLALWLTEEAKALENLCATEMSRRKEIEEALAGEKQEVERMRNQQDKFLKELQMVQDQKSVLEDQLEESQSIVKELEEKIISAVKLLISFKEKRDKLRIENVNAVTELRKLRRVLNGEVPSFCSVQIPAFSFMEINEATHNFDPTWKIAEGRYGSVYKGILRHIHVAIKMLPSYGCQSQLDFQNEVELLSRVRHPNLLTLIGTCPESRSLVYEHVENGSLEDRLACKGNTCPLPWQIRTKIAADICSTLIFLHSNKPHIVHGNLKPKNENLEAVLDISAGDWPLKQAKQLAQLGLRCCEKNQLNRPDLVSEIWSLLEQMRASCIASASCLVSKKSGKIPSNFMCPIYQEVMTDPQIAADGYTYESEAIRGWFESGHNTSPMTNLKLQHCDLVPNYALQNAILEWQQHL